MMRRPARAATWAPERHWQRVALWVVGVALGAVAAGGLLSLPLAWMAVAWGVLVGMALLMAWRVEPVVAGGPVTEAAAEPPLGSAPPTVRPLLDMVAIAGGEFVMGSPPATEEELREYAGESAKKLGGDADEHMERHKTWRTREEPAHSVRVASFMMGRTPVTRGQWRAVIDEVPGAWAENGGDDNLPATHVDWYQAIRFCNALSAREGLTACYRQEGDNWLWERSADGYRLPTEAEWEYTCRAGTTTRWFWGDDSAEADRYAWLVDNALGVLQPVAQKFANPWGLMDMAGLVFEWCWDWLEPYTLSSAPSSHQAIGLAAGAHRVVRGGSVLGPCYDLRSAFRGFSRPVGRDIVLGLRCARSDGLSRH